ncbi:hypothetical protein Z517_07760 [Fonsecaea pedrosoi CBS 271.37]|uniref:Uncharacterized protein n=1 Tax=Fonsecaea pedrosoi CBS 271.37 TaxID=1442368 RepID=A0A0D2EUK1_9EURO|nr:uncharacterized protein Z517_07760 [Fonsecaea pedrosoi CBS 271.37]KIW77927.1 hypothetical protein Z517_07760 [Fonsecaea pedrosoi CBS 271.37]
MVTTRSQERKNASFTSPFPPAEADSAWSPDAGITPTRKPKTPSASIPARETSLGPPVKKNKIEVVINIAPNQGITPNLLRQEGPQYQRNEMGQIISQSRSANVGLPSVSDGLEGTSSHDAAKTVQADDRDAPEKIPQDGRDVQTTLADRSKRPVSPSNASASTPKRRRFSSGSLEEVVPEASILKEQRSGAADQGGEEESDDDSAPEVVSSSVAAQQVWGVPNSSLQRTKCKTRRILRNVDERDDYPMSGSDTTTSSKPQNRGPEQDTAGEPTASGRIPQQSSAESDTGQALMPTTDNSSPVRTSHQETIEIINESRSGEALTPADATTQSAEDETRPLDPENIDTAAQLELSEPLGEEDISASIEINHRMDPEQEDHHAVNLSNSLSQASSCDISNLPSRGQAETEVNAESNAMNPSPGDHSGATLEARTKRVGGVDTELIESWSRSQRAESIQVKMPNVKTPMSRNRSPSRSSLHAPQVSSRPRPSSLQQYRTRLLDRHPRSANWGPPGFRKSKFVGV